MEFSSWRLVIFWCVISSESERVPTARAVGLSYNSDNYIAMISSDTG